MTGTVAIANQALLQLGANPIESLTQGTTSSTLISSLYAPTRKMLLRIYKFNFSIHRVELGQNSTTPVYGYNYEYNLPSDLVRLLAVENDSDYRVEDGKILTNSTTCKICYVYDVTDENKWDTLFSQMMVSRLRVDMAYAITKDKDQVKIARDLFLEITTRAMFVDAVEDYPETFGEYDNTLIGVRS